MEAQNYIIGVVVAAVCLAVVGAEEEEEDNRRRAPPRNLFTIRNQVFHVALAEDKCNEGWFKRHLRCTRSSFDAVVHRIGARWLEINEPIGGKSHFNLQDRVAVAIHYFSHADGYAATGAFMGKQSKQYLNFLCSLIYKFN